MTETAPAPALAGPELDRAIIEASRAYIAAQRTRPRGLQLVADTKVALDDLIAQRDGAGG